MIFILTMLLSMGISLPASQNKETDAATLLVLEDKDLFASIVYQLLDSKLQKYSAEKYDWKILKIKIAHKLVPIALLDKSFSQQISAFKKSKLFFDFEEKLIVPKMTFDQIALYKQHEDGTMENPVVENPLSQMLWAKKTLYCAYTDSSYADDFLKKNVNQCSYNDVKYALNPGFRNVKLSNGTHTYHNRYITQNIADTLKKFSPKKQNLLISLLKKKLADESKKGGTHFLENELAMLESCEKKVTNEK